MSSPISLSASTAPVKGVRIGTACSGMRYQGRDDLALFELVEGSAIAAVFTRNRFCAAPVILAKQRILQHAPVRYLIVNAGNANAGTGEDGMTRAKRYCDALADLTGVDTDSILPFSTGVIGQPLDDGAIVVQYPALLQSLHEDCWDAAAKAIMTTDTVAKKCSVTLNLQDKQVALTGIAKGSGMIHPNMATMLAFIATDLQIQSADLQAMLRLHLEKTFNAISVDGDTSTNDACVCVATGAADISYAQLNSAEKTQFSQALHDLMQSLAHAIVLDGEGAGKFIEINVSGTIDDKAAKEIANTIATSPLVKTAMAASDANWGRIIAAIGRARVDHMTIEGMSLSINGVMIWQDNALCADYSEEEGMRAMASPKIRIDVIFKDGQGHATVWTSDLTTEYVRINADYRS